MTDFEEIYKDIKEAKEGKNRSIPIGIEKLNDYAAFREKMFVLLFSTSGAGKSKLSSEMMLNACEYHMNNSESYRPKFIMFSMERSKKFQLCNWIIRRIFLDTGVTIFISKLLGWTDNKLTDEELKLVEDYEDYVERLLSDYITIYEGAKTPNEIEKILEKEFKDLGTIDNNNKYVPKDSNILPIIIIDHGNLTKTNTQYPTKKQAIDALTEIMQKMRDFYSANILWVAQINRSISSLAGNKDSEVEPSLESIRDSGDTGMAVDLAISLFDPLKYKQSSKTGYNPVDFVCPTTGSNFFRSVQIVKSTYFSDSIRIALAFNGFISQFKTLPKRKDLSELQYQNLYKSVINKSYFLQKS